MNCKLDIETSNNNNSNGLNSGAIELADNVQKLEDNISEKNDKNVGNILLSLEENLRAKGNQLTRIDAIEGNLISIYYCHVLNIFLYDVRIIKTACNQLFIFY